MPLARVAGLATRCIAALPTFRGPGGDRARDLSLIKRLLYH